MRLNHGFVNPSPEAGSVATNPLRPGGIHSSSSGTSVQCRGADRRRDDALPEGVPSAYQGPDGGDRFREWSAATTRLPRQLSTGRDVRTEDFLKFTAMLCREVDFVIDPIQRERHRAARALTDRSTVEIINVDGDCSLHKRFLVSRRQFVPRHANSMRAMPTGDRATRSAGQLAASESAQRGRCGWCGGSNGRRPSWQNSRVTVPAAETAETVRQRGHPILASMLVIGVSAGSVVLALRAFGECDVGINQSANLLSAMILGLPALVVVNGLAVLLTGSLVRRAARSHPSADHWAFMAQLLILLLSACLCWRYVATPAGYPSPICTDNVPPWVPSWLPS